jgi:methionine-rich copper-binding protein CopC
MLRLAATLTCIALLAAPPALAHAVLMDSTPAANAHVAAGPLAITLRYNSRIDARRSKVTLTAPNGATARLDTKAGRTPEVLQANIAVAPGDYKLRWQVLAVDGHITRGTLPFTVDAK